MSTQQDINAFRAQRIANTHDPLALMENTQTPFHLDHSSLITYMQHPQPNNNFVSQPSFNTNYLQHPMQNPGDISNPTTAFNMALALMAKAFTLNDTTPTNNNQRNNVGNQFRPNAMQNVGNQVVLNASQNPGVQNVGNQNGLSVVSEIANQHGDGKCCYNSTTRLRCRLLKRKKQGFNSLLRNLISWPLLQVHVRKPKRANANCHLVNKFAASISSGTPVLQEQYTELLEPIPEPHQVQQNNSNVISEVSSVEQSGEIVDQHSANVEETRAHFESLYNNLATEVEKVNLVNRKMKETNAELTTELASMFGYGFCQNDNQQSTECENKVCQAINPKEKPPSSSRPKLYVVTPLPNSTAFPKVGETNALSKPVTSNSVPSSRESTVVKNERVIAPGIFMEDQAF
ncbi:hypothetical protein Tco_1320793 [Tanacetum coccineum]